MALRRHVHATMPGDRSGEEESRRERATTMSVEQRPEIEALQAEGVAFEPPAELATTANAQPGIYEEAEADFEAFWARRARELIDWETPFHTTLEWEEPFAKWFVGGRL